MKHLFTSLKVQAALAALLATSVHGIALGGTLTAAGVRADIRARGPAAVLNDLWDKPGWDELLRNIETGQSGWLRVAVKIHPATDGAASDTLTLAVGEALLHNPRVVLLQVAPELGIQSVCSAPDVDDARWDTKDKALADLDARIVAVTRLAGPDIAAARASCLQHLNEARAYLVSANGPYS